MLFAAFDGGGAFWFLIAVMIIGYGLKKGYALFDKDGSVHKATHEGVVNKIKKWLN